METTYFSIDAKRILVYGEAQARQAVGGGAGSACYMVIPRRRAVREAPRGKVLDFEACRRALEETAEPAVLPTGEETPVRAAEGEGKPPRLSLLLDWAATAAITGMAIAVVLLFLRL